MIYFTDLSHLLVKMVPQDKRNQMGNPNLDNYLTLFNIGNKMDHDYYDLQQRLATPNSVISDLISYNLYDTTCLLLLDQATSCLAKIIEVQALL